ncbi:alpha/beta hydrolase [Acetobacteraceae bacterium H6797]|nr:alpha/beta hydrolase [Acetobacteraceae bacterium H6797]
MPSFTTKDGTEIFYKDWGSGLPIVFSHGWPLSSDAWETQMLHLSANGFRCIAHDRRGHGRSSQTFHGNDMNTYADDLHALLVHLNLRDVMLVGHSTGGAEVTRLVGRHGPAKIRKVVLIGAVTPKMAKGADNPDGLPMEVFDGIRAGLLKDKSQFFKDFAPTFFGVNNEGQPASQGMQDAFWVLGMQAGLKNIYECVSAFSETDLTQDLKDMSMPVLIIHGDDDQVVPIELTAKRAVQIAPNATLKVYPGGSHALPDMARDQLNADLLAFAKA